MPLPPCMPNYRLGALVGSACDTLNPVPPVDTLYTIKIYPVPANDVLNIELPTKTQRVAIVVYNAMGVVVHRYAASPLLTTKLKIRTASYARGVYHLKISTESGDYFRKFTIE
ncbi:MAG: T9SS type A sorting domain-containing protein [Bacteroidota bacterium]|nr:MAG: T9SS type A sorting domain-containing protein [Bacteroidota bacterium]